MITITKNKVKIFENHYRKKPSVAVDIIIEFPDYDSIILIKKSSL